MRKATVWRLVITVLLAFLAAVAIFAIWIIPGSINGRIRALVPGSRARIDRWWAAGNSGGIAGLVWFEGYHNDSPAWARARWVETDLGIWALLGGRTSPSRIVLIEPAVTIRLDRDGRLQIPSAFQRPDDPSQLSVIEIKRGSLRIEQEGRPPMVVSAIDGTLKHGPDGWTLTAKTQDPEWGHWRADGSIQPDFSDGSLTISGLNIQATAEKTACIPWVPPRAWELVRIAGPLDVRETITYQAKSAKPVRAATWVNLRGASAKLPRLEIEVEGVRGQVDVADRVMTIHHANGFALDGTVGVNGTIDYNGGGTVADLDVRLDDVSVAEAPTNWRLESLEIRGGQLSGTAKVRASVTPDRLDLSGSSGEAVVTRANVRGIPVQSLTIRMRGEGPDLRYESDPPPAEPPLPSAFSSRLMQAARLMSGLSAIRSGRPGARLVIPLASFGKPSRGTSPTTPWVDWPMHASGRIELDHVAIEDLIDEANRVGVRLPFEATGQMSLQLDSTVPMDNPAQLGDYRGAGRVEFHGAEVAGIALDGVRARVRLAGGVLELSEFQPLNAVEIPAGSVHRVAAVEEAAPR